MMRKVTPDGTYIWSKAVQTLPVEYMKFALNAAVDMLPHNANLHLWKKKPNDSCPLCGERQTLVWFSRPFNSDCLLLSSTSCVILLATVDSDFLVRPGSSTKTSLTIIDAWNFFLERPSSCWRFFSAKCRTQGSGDVSSWLWCVAKATFSGSSWNCRNIR